MTFPATDPPTYSNSMTFSRTSPLPSPHFDKRFFDSSLIEMKSQASSSSTLDYDSTEEVWVRRVDFVQERKRKVSVISFLLFIFYLLYILFVFYLFYLLFNYSIYIFCLVFKFEKITVGIQNIYRVFQKYDHFI